MPGTDAQSMLDAVNAAIAAFLASGGIREYTLPNGQIVKRESITELRAMRDQLKSEVAQQSRPLYRPVILGRARP